VSVQRIALELDSGDILAQEAFPLDPRETTESLARRAGELGSRLVLSVVRQIALGREVAVPQDHSRASYCGVIGKEEGEIDWTKPALEIDALVRAYTPWPLSYSFLRGQRLNILETFPLPPGEAAGTQAGAGNPAETGDKEPGVLVGIDKGRGILVQTGQGMLALGRLQFEARKALGFRDFANGTRDLLGAKLGRG
jgi:methionyl-tRNA formyltransferase